MTSQITHLVCPDCQHQNELERIYCHNCGARLDRTGVNKAEVADGDSEEAGRRHLKKMFDPSSGRGKRLATKLAKLILGALGLAVLIVMLLPPDLPPAPKSYEFAPLINMDIVSALSSQRPATLVYSEEQVNSYFGSLVRRKDGPATQGYFPLRRLFVQFQEGQCAIHAERKLFGLSVFCGSTYRVALEQGKIKASNGGGYIGRMPIAPALMKYADLMLGKAWESLDRERKSVARLAGIEFHPQSVTLVAIR
ncbi:MAG: zinc ribbon domain-containing protein [Verrucomicrobiota bacterium]|nr:zinc ribbon domain-containing protein [Verrucomicrobiota bacterium]